MNRWVGICSLFRDRIAIAWSDAEAHLEKVMLDFMAGEYDLLLSTAIVEAGLDIPNVNTIIIHDAENSASRSSISCARSTAPTELPTLPNYQKQV